jgi:hypothetical protein
VTLLIVAMLLVVLPLPMGMAGMGWCPACLTGHAGQALGLCLAILSSAVLMLGSLGSGRNRPVATVLNKTVFACCVLRPPRLPALGL